MLDKKPNATHPFCIFRDFVLVVSSSTVGWSKINYQNKTFVKVRYFFYCPWNQILNIQKTFNFKYAVLEIRWGSLCRTNEIGHTKYLFSRIYPTRVRSPAALGYCHSFFEKSKNIVISNNNFPNVKKYSVINRTVIVILTNLRWEYDHENASVLRRSYHWSVIYSSQS